MRRPLASVIRRFARDEDGAVTVETVIWLPFLFLILALITDASLAFYSKADAFRIIQNGNRLYSIGALDTTAKVETFVETVFRNTAINADATTVVDDDGLLVGTSLSYPLQNVMLFSDVPNNWRITVQSIHYIEWPKP